MRTSFLVPVAFVIVAVGVGQTPAQTRTTKVAGDAGATLPVRIAPSSGLGAKLDIEAALKKPLEEGWPTWDVTVGKTRQKLQLRTCLDYFKVAGQQVETENPPDQRPFNNAAGHCEALAMLRDARPSERSYLDDFRLDTDAARLLPANLYLDMSPDDKRRVQVAVRAGRTWKALDPKVRSKVNQRGNLESKGDGYESELTEYARGDFDHDGVEDILIRRMASLDGGSMVDYAVFLLTRTSATAPLKALKTWRQAY